MIRPLKIIVLGFFFLCEFHPGGEGRFLNLQPGKRPARSDRVDRLPDPRDRGRSVSDPDVRNTD